MESAGRETIFTAVKEHLHEVSWAILGVATAIAFPAAANPPDQSGRHAIHWAFQKPLRPAVPASRLTGHTCRNAIDGFVFARLQQEGLTPAPEADRTTLIRRVSLDLIGLPPAPA